MVMGEKDMPENLRIVIESSFNVTYLIVVWSLVVLMVLRRKELSAEDRPAGQRMMWAFALLALGDTGHVGFRVWGYSTGGLEKHVSWMGLNLSPVGLGALATAITVTFFYVLTLDTWRVRFGKTYGPFEYLLLGAAVVRLAIMALPANEWASVVPPQPMSLYRNLPLMVQGLGAAYLILRDASRRRDRIFQWIGIMILISYACYTPVILFVQVAPLLGMLMIPKTMAYLGVAFLVYGGLYRRQVPAVKPA